MSRKTRGKKKGEIVVDNNTIIQFPSDGRKKTEKLLNEDLKVSFDTISKDEVPKASTVAGESSVNTSATVRELASLLLFILIELDSAPETVTVPAPLNRACTACKMMLLKERSVFRELLTVTRTIEHRL